MEYYAQQDRDAAELEVLRAMTSEMNTTYFSGSEQPAITEGSRPGQRLFAARGIMAMAATVALLVFAGLYWFRSPDLLEQYGHIPAVSIAERGADADKDWKTLTQAINAHEYKKALPLSRDILMGDTSSLSAREYYGLCLLHTGDYAGARRWLQYVAQSGSLLQYRAVLLTGLSYYKEGDKEAARKQWEQIPAAADEYIPAQKLLEQVR